MIRELINNAAEKSYNDRITAVVFSRNRPLQLDGLLRSIECFGAYSFDSVTVLYRVDAPFRKAYDHLIALFPGVHFVERKDIKQDTLEALYRADAYACFLTDDSLLFRNVHNGFMPLLTGDVLCMSLRMGLNTTYCYPVDQAQVVPDYKMVGTDLMQWDWTSAQLDFGYPFSIDGSIFSTWDLVCFIKKLNFNSPNELESNWQICKQTVNKPLMLAYTNSRLTNLPLNRVQMEINNRHEGGSFEELNQKFLDGYCIDLDAMDFSDVRAAHHPLPLRLCHRYELGYSRS